MGRSVSVGEKVWSAAYVDGRIKGCVGPGRLQKNSNSGDRGLLRENASVITAKERQCRRAAERLRGNGKLEGSRAAGAGETAVRDF